MKKKHFPVLLIIFPIILFACNKDEKIDAYHPKEAKMSGVQFNWSDTSDYGTQYSFGDILYPLMKEIKSYTISDFSNWGFNKEEFMYGDFFYADLIRISQTFPQKTKMFGNNLKVKYKYLDVLYPTELDRMIETYAKLMDIVSKDIEQYDFVLVYRYFVEKIMKLSAEDFLLENVRTNINFIADSWAYFDVLEFKILWEIESRESRVGACSGMACQKCCMDKWSKEYLKSSNEMVYLWNLLPINLITNSMLKAISCTVDCIEPVK